MDDAKRIDYLARLGDEHGWDQDNGRVFYVDKAFVGPNFRAALDAAIEQEKSLKEIAEISQELDL